MTIAPTSFADKVAEFNLGAAKALHAGGVEAILSQMKLHAEIVAGMTETIRETIFVFHVFEGAV